MSTPNRFRFALSTLALSALFASRALQPVNAAETDGVPLSELIATSELDASIAFPGFIDLSSYLPDLPETIEIRKLNAELKEKVASDTTVAEAEAKYKSAGVSRDKALTALKKKVGAAGWSHDGKKSLVMRKGNGETIAPSPETQPFFDAVILTFEEVGAARSALEKARRSAEAADSPTMKRIDELRKKQWDAFRPSLDFQSEVRTAHQAYDRARSVYLNRLKPSLSELSKLDEKIAKAGQSTPGNNATSADALNAKRAKLAVPILSSKNDAMSAGREYYAAMSNAVVALLDVDLCIQNWKNRHVRINAAAPTFDARELAEARREIFPIRARLSRDSAQRARYREEEARNTPELRKIAASLSAAAELEKRTGALESKAENICKQWSAQAEKEQQTRGSFGEATDKSWRAARNDRDAAQARHKPAWEALKKAQKTYDDAVVFAVLSKLPCVAAPAVAKIDAAYRTNPFDPVAYDAAVAEYKALAKTVPQDATESNATIHWPEFVDSVSTVQPGAGLSSKPQSPRFRWYAWTGAGLGSPQKVVRLETSGSGPSLFDSVGDDVARAEIAAHARVPGYPTYTRTQANLDSDAILDRIYAKANPTK